MKKETLKQKVIDKSWWPTGTQPYQLLSRGRVEMLTEVQARVLNQYRAQSHYEGQWKEFPDAAQRHLTKQVTTLEPQQNLFEPEPAKAREHTSKPTTPVVDTFSKPVTWWIWYGRPQSAVFIGKFESRTRVGAIVKAHKKNKQFDIVSIFAVSAHEYAERARRRREENKVAREQQELDMSKKEKEKAKDKSSKKETKKTESQRPQWNGHGMCDLIRWCGSQKMSKAQAMAVLKHAGFEPSPTTIFIQLKKGKDGKNVPTLKKDEAKELSGVAKNVKEEEPKKKDKSKKKDSGKAKSKKKKVKVEEADDEVSEDDDEEAASSDDDDDAEAEAEAEAEADADAESDDE